MALQTSGQISLNDIHIEAGGSSGSQASINDTDIRDLISKGSGAQMSFSEWYGATAETVLSSAGTVNGQPQQKEITVSSFISSGGTFRIPSNMWVWSDNRNTPALTIDIPCTVINEGKIIGKGGGYTASYVADRYVGGPAIKITSSGVTLTNASGAYIAGGGGAGAGSPRGGGAGGGNGGTSNGTFNDQVGGALNAVGGDFDASSSIINSNAHGHGGGSGGGGGGIDYLSAFGSPGPGGGGGGGRILPGTGGAQGYGSRGNGGAGGSAGNAGSNGYKSYSGSSPGGGGGGWGASGGSDGGSSYGSAGGAAIDDSGNSYTFTNSGTVYGAT